MFLFDRILKNGEEKLKFGQFNNTNAHDFINVRGSFETKDYILVAIATE